jgi:tetratricopeptide (TPR) repeat protein
MDYGYGELRGNPKPRKLSSFGAGLRMSLYNQVFLRLEWGIPFKFLGGQPALTEGSTKGRFHFSMNIEDKIPEEVDRIIKEMREERKVREAKDLVDAELSVPDSPLARKLYGYMDSAETLEKEGKLKEARDMYSKALAMGKSLRVQAYSYIEGCAAHYEELEKKNEEALALYREGKIMEARKVWIDMREHSRPRPLEFNI